MARPRVFGVTGWKNSGKTTLIERLIPEFSARGISVSTIKHAHHGFDIDTPGKDSYRHRAAGAREVLVASSGRWVLMHEAPSAPAPALEDLIDRLSPCDLVLVEGFKSGSQPKIEVVRAPGRESRIADTDRTVCAIATDDRRLAEGHPFLLLNDTAAIAAFVCRHCGLPGQNETNRQRRESVG